MAKYEKVCPLEIEDIIETTDKGMWVKVKATGKLAWLPKSRSQVFPGMVYIPEWLFDKICPAV